MSSTVEVAEAVEAAINAATFSLTPDNVVRSYFPIQELKDIGTDLTLNIVTGDRERERSNRSQIREEVTVSVSVEQKLAGRTNAIIDPLIALTEEIEDELEGRLTTTGGLDCHWIKTEPVIPWSYDILKKEGLYFSISKFTYRIIR